MPAPYNYLPPSGRFGYGKEVTDSLKGLVSSIRERKEKSNYNALKDSFLKDPSNEDNYNKLIMNSNENQRRAISMVKSSAQNQKKIQQEAIRKDVAEKTKTVTYPIASTIKHGRDDLFAEYVESSMEEASAGGNEIVGKFLAPVLKEIKNGNTEMAKTIFIQNTREVDPNLYKSVFGKAASDKDLVDAKVGTEGEKQKELRSKVEGKKDELEGKKLELEAKRAALVGKVGRDRADRVMNNPYYKKSVNSQTETTNMLSKIYGITSRMKDKDGKQIKFGGKWDSYTRKMETFFDGLQGNKKTQIVANLVASIEEMKLSSALKNKPPGAISEKELAILLETVPGKNAGDEQIAKWMADIEKMQHRAFAADLVRQAYVENRGNHLSAKEDFALNVNGRNISIKKGQNPESVILKLRRDEKLHEYFVFSNKEITDKDQSVPSDKGATDKEITEEDNAEFDSWIGDE